MPVQIGALKESAPRETRVSLTPEIADKLAKEGAQVLIEHGAGERACFPDGAYKNVSWGDSAAAVLSRADVLLTVQPLTLEQIAQLKPGAVVIGFMQPYARAAEVRAAEPCAGEVRADEIRVVEVRAGEPREAEVRVGEVRAAEDRAGEVDSLTVIPGDSASNDSYGSLHVGTDCPRRQGVGLGYLRRQSISGRRGRRPLLVRMLADERR